MLRVLVEILEHRLTRAVMGQSEWVVAGRDGVFPVVLAKKVTDLQDGPEDKIRPEEVTSECESLR